MRRRALAFALVLLAGNGCLGRSYEQVMRVHMEVLVSMARKLCAVAESGRPPATEAMSEYVYPWKRGRQFTQYFAEEHARPSFVRFGELLVHYEALVRLADESRVRDETWRQRSGELCARAQDVEHAAAEVREAVLAEGRS
jgi:hypothetical protein